ncbi:MAG: hypothetical protein LRY28_01770 [Erysipelotrichaceae bacterium]|nr:hypothetical protein [Erysipelotrichaceae bacterium]
MVKLPLTLVLSATSIIALVFVFYRDMNFFLVLSILFFILNSLYLILIQVYSGSMSRFASNASVMGLYNAIRSLGMVFGSFFAGALYQNSIPSAFAYTSATLFIASLFFILAIQQKKV